MSTCVGIRTYRWTDEEQRIFERLHPVFGADLVAVVHNPAPDFRAPLDIVPLTDSWVAQQGLRDDIDYGWRCGDYAYYALRSARPGYDFYWLVEPDIHFSSDPTAFFECFDSVNTDALGLDIRPFQYGHRWTEGMPAGMDFIFAIFALTRFSGRALDRLYPLRVEMSKREIFKRKFPNDELFSFSHANADPELTIGNLRDCTPDWFEDAAFQTEPDMLVDAIIGKVPSGKVFHPVRDKEAIVTGLAKRITERLTYLKRMSETFAYFDDSDIEKIISDVSEDLRRKMVASRRRGRG